MPLPEFKNEREFRDKWIAPFLAKLGFMNIKNTHGPAEQGKDFFFTDYDRFGHPRYYAAQVKLGNIGSGGKEINELLDQVKRCFGVKLRFHKGAHEQRISAVYVMTNGTISEQARVQIHDSCLHERYGENVYFLDGEQLENKDRFSTYESDQQKRQLLRAFHHEVCHNIGKLQSQKERFSSTGKCSQYRLTALESALLRLDFQEEETLSWYYLDLTWSGLNEFNNFQAADEQNIKDEAVLGFEFSRSSLLKKMDALLQAMELLRQQCRLSLEELNSRYSLEATVEPDSGE